MAELGSLITPAESTVQRNCYPLWRQETYIFPDGTRFERDLPYFRPPIERFVDAYGTVQHASSQHEARSGVLELLRVVDPCIANSCGEFFDVPVQRRISMR